MYHSHSRYVVSFFEEIRRLERFEIRGQKRLKFIPSHSNLRHRFIFCFKYSKTTAMENSCKNKPNASDDVRHGLVVFLSQRHKNGRLNKGAIAAAKEHFPFEKSQINRIWKLARDNAVNPNVKSDYKTKKKGNSGRKPKYSEEYVMAAIGRMPLSLRQSLRTLSSATSIPARSCRL